jgi:DNA-binding MarR family transcriptional regulator
MNIPLRHLPIVVQSTPPKRLRKTDAGDAPKTARTPRKRAGVVAGSATGTKFLDEYLPYLFGHASAALNKDFDRYVQVYGITPLEWRVLATLCDDNGLTIGELARKVVAQQPTLTKAIKKMEDSGLVDRSSDAEDLRKTLAHVTKEGRELYATLATRALQHEKQWLRGISDDEIRLLRKILQTVIHRGRSPLAFLD